MGVFDSGCNWYCDSCHAYMNNQPGFTTALGTWTCAECGTVNDVSENNIIPENGSDGYVFEAEYDDGTTEKIRYTKHREVHDFDGPNGKISILAKMEIVALDSGRYATPSPDISFIHSREDPTIAKYQYRYFLRNSIEYYVQQFLYDADNSEEVYAKQRFDNIVLYFDNEQQEEQFRVEIESRPEVLTLYIKKEEEPEVHSGNKELNQEYANRIKVSKALKAFQNDWNLHRNTNFE